MRIRKEKEIVGIDDRVNGLEGSFIGLEEAEADDPNLDAVRVLYIPGEDVTTGWLSKIAAGIKSIFLGEKMVEKTNTIYPRDAVIGPFSLVSNEEGTPNRKVILLENQYGNAPYEENHLERRREKKISQLSSRKESLEKESGMKDVDSFDRSDNQNQEVVRESMRQLEKLGVTDDE